MTIVSCRLVSLRHLVEVHVVLCCVTVLVIMYIKMIVVIFVFIYQCE